MHCRRCAWSAWDLSLSVSKEAQSFHTSDQLRASFRYVFRTQNEGSIRAAHKQSRWIVFLCSLVPLSLFWTMWYAVHCHAMVLLQLHSYSLFIPVVVLLLSFRPKPVPVFNVDALEMILCDLRTKIIEHDRMWWWPWWWWGGGEASHHSAFFLLSWFFLSLIKRNHSCLFSFSCDSPLAVCCSVPFSLL